MSESVIGGAWRTARAGGRAALIPYMTAGYPTVADSRAMLIAASEYSDIIEVGVPFSDPLADGPTIQASTFRALENGMTLPRTLELVANAAVDRPVVLFSYLNPMLQYGVERMVRDAASAGVAGILLTDLPAGADVPIERALSDGPLDLIRLVSPTTTAERLRASVDSARGFIYLVARLGVTGVSDAIDGGLEASIARVRATTALPIAVGFGISTPEQAAHVARYADGVVVGSALVDILGRDGVAGASRFLGGMRAALESA